jgi:hypothetical protein
MRNPNTSAVKKAKPSHLIEASLSKWLLTTMNGMDATTALIPI